jgi:hypothetical protein
MFAGRLAFVAGLVAAPVLTLAAMPGGMWLARFLGHLPSLSAVATPIDPLET